MPSRHLVAFHELALRGDINLNRHVSASGQVVAGETRLVGPGDCVFVPSGNPHGMTNRGQVLLRYFGPLSEFKNDRLPIPMSFDSRDSLFVLNPIPFAHVALYWQGRDGGSSRSSVR